MSKISAYTAITSVAGNDLLAVVDVDDTTMASSGTDKQIRLNQLYGNLAPWQFPVEAYGAKGDGRYINDGAMTSGAYVLSVAGLTAPAAPTLAHAGTGGTILAGTYQVEVTYVNPYGETTASASASVTTTGSTSTITVNAPALQGGATAWYAYVTQAGGSSYTRQQPAGAPTVFGGPDTTPVLNLVLTAPPTSSGAQPPVSNTTASNPFTSADVGKYALVWFNGPASWLFTTIAGFTDSAHVTLADAAPASVSGAGVAYGTDDTAAIRNALAAALAYTQAPGTGTYAEVVFRPVIYCLAAPAVLGGATLGNAQIPLPANSMTADTPYIAFKGLPSSPSWWRPSRCTGCSGCSSPRTSSSPTGRG